MHHIRRDRFVPAAPPRHARLFELIRQDGQAHTASAPKDRPSPNDTPLTAAKLAAFRDLACASLRR
jgi:hypothetical protein